jgi:para-aminobenzoate synthetase
MKILLIDNYDSFTFNLYQYLAELTGTEPYVVRNDDDWDLVNARPFEAVVISPGPGRPERPSDFGISARALAMELPVLGVCLGHQGMAYAAGAQIVHARVPMHGRVSRLFHSGHPLFAGIAQGTEVVRYHSLLAAAPLPPSCETIGWTDDGLIMAFAHRDRLHVGVQFHPESISTVDGKRLLGNFVALAAAQTCPALPVPSRLAGRTRTPPVATCHRRVMSRRLPQSFDAEAVFLAIIADQPYGFWLDSAVSDGRGRFSFLGAATGGASFAFTYSVALREVTVHHGDRITKHQGDVFEFIGKVLGPACESPDLPFDLNGGLVGFLGYEVKAECGGDAAHTASTPDAGFIFADRLIALDQETGATYLVAVVDSTAALTGAHVPTVAHDPVREAEAWFSTIEHRLAHLPRPAAVPSYDDAPEVQFTPRHDREAYVRDIAKCLNEIRDGESYEICLTTQFCSELDLDPVLFYRLLRRINPAPYCSYLRFGDVAIASSSPERFMRVDRARWAESRPIKGTRRRDDNDELDIQLKRDLQTSEKDRAENLMIVDLVRNDLGQCCEVGTVSVPSLMAVETYATVHQLVSTVRGHLKPQVQAIDVIRAAFPGGSMTGAPKRRTMQIIDGLEGGARGVYSGAIGFFALNGTADLSIVIRTAVLTPGRITVGAGGAIVAMSDPNEEWAEVMLKTQPLRRAAATCWAAQHALAVTLKGAGDRDRTQGDPRRCRGSGSGDRAPAGRAEDRIIPGGAFSELADPALGITTSLKEK